MICLILTFVTGVNAPINMLPNTLLPLFPPVADAVRDGELTLELAKQAWSDIAGQFDPAPALVILFGSIIEGRAKPYSDIDLMLVVDHGNQPRRRQVVANGYLFDITIFPRPFVARVAAEASRSLAPARIIPFLYGRAIAGSTDLFDELQREVQQIYATRFENQLALLASMESNLLGMLTDLSGAASPEIGRCLVLEAKSLALNILSVRTFCELLPPAIMVQKGDAAFGRVIADIVDFPAEDSAAFIRAIVGRVQFQAIKGWDR